MWSDIGEVLTGVLRSPTQAGCRRGSAPPLPPHRSPPPPPPPLPTPGCPPPHRPVGKRVDSAARPTRPTPQHTTQLNETQTPQLATQLNISYNMESTSSPQRNFSQKILILRLYISSLENNSDNLFQKVDKSPIDKCRHNYTCIKLNKFITLNKPAFTFMK